MSDAGPSGVAGASGPKWRTVAEAIAVGVRSGRWPVGEEVPAARDLADEHNVDTNTALAAMRHLAEIGVLESRPGRRMVVLAVPPEHLPSRTVLDRLADLERRLDEHERRHQEP